MDKAAQNQNNQTANQTNDKIVTDQGQYAPISSTPNKEVGATVLKEAVRPSEPEVKLSEELINVGIVANTDKPKLNEVHEKIGLVESAESTPVKTTTTGNVILPMSEQEAEVILKNKKSNFNLHESVGEFAGEYTEDSLPFFATLIVKVVKEMHRRLFKKKT